MKVETMKGGLTVGCQRLTEKLKNKIKKDYIDGKGTYRELAEKYNVSYYAIEKIASARHENWRKQKTEKWQKTAEKATEKAIEYESNTAVRIEQGLDMISQIVTDKLKNNDLSKADAEILNSAAEIYMKCQKIGGFKCKAELEEQQARIEKLRADTELARSKINHTTDSTDALTLNIVFPE